MVKVETVQVGASRESLSLLEPKEHRASTKLDEPFVSIIVPTRNEEKYIGQCLKSLASQTYPKDKFEVIIVDGLSEDKTLQVVKSFSEKLCLRILENSKKVQVFGLNLGIEVAIFVAPRFVTVNSKPNQNVASFVTG